MKIEKHKALELGSLSPITKKGEVVYSRIEVQTDPNEPMNPWHVTYTPDATEALKVLRFLDDMNGIGWTPRLKKLEEQLRDELLDLMTADKSD